MLVKLLFLVVLYVSIIVADGPKWKEFGLLERIAYSMIVIAAGYLSVIYVTDWSLPNLDDLLNAFFAGPARSIVESVKLPS
ncbi:hypothetical protein [Paenibacillus spongiae]|uniref:Stage III sporulation protein AC n=1 Tax=Paenibacillus spongiae TaxID=2909671 RepID=A0ABY5SJ48_9BACL|nr:hypothetical protein [Paenibacillus spongiae]UVI32628.1 hypothetical protein L1F29_12720 [Paenibacillus spongiae]